VLLDLHDVAMLGLKLEKQWAESPEQRERNHQDALAIAKELERRKLQVSALSREMEYHARELGQQVKSVAFEPRTAWDHYLHGRLLLQSGQLAEASQQLDRAIEMDPRLPVFYFEAGNSALQQRHYDKARYMFTVCLALTRANQTEAKRSVKTTHAQTHDLEVCYFKRGLAELGSSLSNDAEADFTAALELNPGLGVACLNRGLVYRERGQTLLALADLHRALERGASPALAHYNLALTYWDAGLPNPAGRHLRQAQLSPNCPADATRLQSELQKKDSQSDSSED